MNAPQHRHHRRPVLQVIIALGCFAAVGFTASIVATARSAAALAPPEGVNDIHAFAAQMPPPEHLAFIQYKGEPFVVWTGELADFPAIPSGPSCYVFDKRGQLVDWHWETGEGHSVDSLSLLSASEPSRTIGEAIEFIDKQP